MASAFVCGIYDENNKAFLHSRTARRMVREFIENKNIDTVYITKRNDFDNCIFIIRVMENIDVQFIEIVDNNKDDFNYACRIKNGVTFERICPFEEEIDSYMLYRTIYGYAIEHCDAMITYVHYDDDLSAVIMERAKEKGLDVLNLAERFGRGPLGGAFWTEND